MDNETGAEGATAGAGKRDKDLGLAAIAIAVAFIAAIFGTIWWRENEPLWKCDALAKETLKSPSSYRRISAECTSATCDIEYEAANSFGVLLRGKGYCTTFEGNTTWYEPPKGPELLP